MSESSEQSRGISTPVKVAIIAAAGTIIAALIATLPPLVNDAQRQDGRNPDIASPHSSATTGSDAQGMSVAGENPTGAPTTVTGSALIPNDTESNNRVIVSRRGGAPTIVFSRVPPVTGGDISGSVSALPDPQNYRVVIYARTNNWFVQPLITQRHTTIDRFGVWYNSTNPGSEYAVLIVRPSYQPAAETLALPPVAGDVLARTQVLARGTE